MRKSENPNNFLKVIVALLIIVAMTVGYNMFLKRMYQMFKKMLLQIMLKIGI